MATCRARGGSPVTRCPSMSTSPEEGCSSPATIRSSVVLPQPDGPRRTRYSPSSVARSIPSTARTPPGNSLTRFLTSTTATGCPLLTLAHQALRPPLVEDRLHLAFGGRDGIPGALLAAGHPGEHVGDDEGVEDLALRRVGRAGVPDVDAPLGRVSQQRELVRRLGPERVGGQPPVQGRRAARERAEVVELAGVRRRGEVARVVEQELLGRVGV